VEDCEAQSGAFKTVLDGVADDTTVASEVLEVEEKQDALNACRDRLEAAVKALQKELGMRAIGQVMEFDGTEYVSPTTTTGPPTPAPPRPPAETYGGVVDAAHADGILSADEASAVSDWLKAGGGSFFQKKVNVTSQFQRDVVAKGKVTNDPAEIWKEKGGQIVKSGLDAGVITSDEAESYVAEFGGCGGCQDSNEYYYYMHYDMDTSTFGYGKCDGTIADWFTYWNDDPWNLGDLTGVADDGTRIYVADYYYYDWTVPVKIQCGGGEGQPTHGWQPSSSGLEKGTDWFWIWQYYYDLELNGETGWSRKSLYLPCAC